MSNSILFGKPQYNWVTGKTEEGMTSSYIHNWNTRSALSKKKNVEDVKSVEDRLSNNGVDLKETKSWWPF